MGAPSQETGPSVQENAVDTKGNDNNDQEADLSPVEATYTSLIQQYLSVYCLDNATFYAERLVATSKTNHSLYLLALCYYRQGKPQRAKFILDNARNPSPAMQYLLAKCCLDLEQYGPAEEALLRTCRQDYRKSEDGQIANNMNDYILTASPCPIPNGAAGLALLGSICKRSNRKQRAIEYYRMSLQLDPMMWTSFEALCELGVGEKELDPTVIFGVHPPELSLAAKPQQAQERGVLTTSFSYSPPEGKSALQPMDVGTPSASFASAAMPKTSLFQSGGGAENQVPTKQAAAPSLSMFQTPNLTPIPNSTGASFAVPPSAAHVRTSEVGSTLPHVVQRATNVISRRYYEPSPELTPIGDGSNRSKAQPRSLFLGGLDASKSFSTIVPEDSVMADDDTPLPPRDTTAARGNKSTTRKPRALSFGTSNATSSPLVGSQLVEDKKDEEQADDDDQQQQLDNDEAAEDKGAQEVLELLCVLGAAELSLGQFRSKEAIELFKRLPSHHYQTGYVMHQVGRAYFEMADYQNSIRYLQMMEQLEPHRMKGLEVLSTALWQMKREVELSHLAQRVTEFDRLSAEVWCVVGNCFSLQKEHETALSFFRRSIQLDPSFTYSHTLSGHEYFANEDFDKAIECYRNAIRADERHYNAWYGLGTIYHCQEKYDLSEYHFHKACMINPQSAVLICHLGMAQNANGKPYAALDTLQAAFRLDPRNPQAHYQRALVYQALERPQEALVELGKVRDAAPREAQIHFSMGRLYKRTGQVDKALRCFLSALDLDAKDSNLIKSAMEKIEEPDVDTEEVSAF